LPWFTSLAKSIAIGIAPHQHGYARASRWQFQIFAETWMKLSRLSSNEEDSCGGACCVSFPPMRTHEMRINNP
jgi:D-hexose-6-phosphate mutarotase